MGQEIDQFMEKDPNAEITALAALGLFEVLSKKAAECKEIIEQYKKTYPDIIHSGVTIIMAAGLFSLGSEDTEGMVPIELVEGYRGGARKLVAKLKEDVEE